MTSAKPQVARPAQLTLDGLELLDRAIAELDELSDEELLGLVPLSLFLLYHTSVDPEWPTLGECLAAARNRLRVSPGLIPLVEHVRAGSGRWNAIEEALSEDDFGAFEYTQITQKRALVSFRPDSIFEGNSLWVAAKLCRGYRPFGAIAALRLLMSSYFDEVIETLREPHAQEGSFEANPLLCAPEALKELGPGGRASDRTRAVNMLVRSHSHPSVEYMADILQAPERSVRSTVKGTTLKFNRKELDTSDRDYWTHKNVVEHTFYAPFEEDKAALLGLFATTRSFESALFPRPEDGVQLPKMVFRTPAILPPMAPRYLYRSVAGLEPAFDFDWLADRSRYGGSEGGEPASVIPPPLSAPDDRLRLAYSQLSDILLAEELVRPAGDDRIDVAPSEALEAASLEAGAEKLADWLLDQDSVDDVFATDRELMDAIERATRLS